MKFIGLTIGVFIGIAIFDVLFETKEEKIVENVNLYIEERFEKILGNSEIKMLSLKQDCEISAKECVLIYEYVPVNTESEK